MNKMRKETNQAIRELSSDTLKCLGSLGCKALYPILGNLSKRLQENIEGSFGYWLDSSLSIHERYDSYHATNTSMVTNGLAYVTVAYELAKNNEAILPFAIGGGAIVGVIEGYVRSWLENNSRMKVLTYPVNCSEEVARAGMRYETIGTSSCASLFGKLVSLPIEAGMLLRNNIKQRAEEIRKRSIR